MKIHTNYNPYSCDYSKVYVSKDGYHFNGSRYESLSEVKREYRQTVAVEFLLKLFAVVVIVVSSLCSGIILLSIINKF